MIISNPLELHICFAIWIFSNVFFFYKLYQSQSEILHNRPVLIDKMPNLKPGCPFLARLRDASDLEWRSFKYFIHFSWPYLIVQFLLKATIRKTEHRFLKYWYIISSIIFVSLFMGYKQIIFILVQPMIYAVNLFCGGREWNIWIIFFAIVASFNCSECLKLIWSFLGHDNELKIISMCCIAWTELRCLSYSLDFIQKSKNSFKINNLEDMLSYCLYLPLLYTGPFILYEDYKNSFSAPIDKFLIKSKILISEMCKFFIYMFLLDLSSHYFYFYAMHTDMQILGRFPTSALIGGALCMGVQFHMKYVIIYGTASAFARLDNMETPPTPRCILRIHVYSQMWKHFDVGLYRFLVRYIYRPSFEALAQYNLPKLTNKMIVSFATFVFIFMWHGASQPVLIWSILNYLGITIEYICKELSQTNWYKWFKKNVLTTKAMETRFTAISCAPLLFVSMMSNLFFFTGTTKVGYFYFEHFYSMSSSWSIVLVSIVLYSCCVVSMALEYVPPRKDMKKPIK